MRLPKAKAYAPEMVRGIWAGRILTDPIKNLRQETHKAMGKSPTSPAPLNIMGGERKRGRTFKVDCETVAETDAGRRQATITGTASTTPR
jgi:hypothetical protein